jgi:ABC-type phosphate transport system ATPase subunit
MSNLWRLFRLLVKPTAAGEKPKRSAAVTGTVSLKLGYLNEVWTASPFACAALGVLSYLLWMLDLVYVIQIAALVENIRLKRESESILIVLTLVTLVRLGVRALLATMELRLAELMAWRFGVAMLGFHNTVDSADRIARFAGRELRILLDSAEAIVRLTLLPLTFISYLAWILYAYGFSVSLALGILAFILPLSIVLARIEDKIFAKVMSISAMRQEKCRRWLRLGPLLINWGRTKTLDVIHQLTRREAKLRNLDSALRSSDTYLFHFGRIVPFSILSFLSLQSTGTASSSIEAYWIAFPLMTLALDLPRLFVAARNGQRALSHMNNLELVSRPIENSKLKVDSNWRIWSGSVARNMIYKGRYAECLVADLGLIGELGTNAGDVLEFHLTSGGRNLSQGQQTRLIIARGVNIALHSNERVCIDCELTSLDRANQLRVQALLETYPGIVELGPNAERSLAESIHAVPYETRGAPSERSNRAVPTRKEYSEKGIFQVLSPAIACFFIPAALPAALAILAEVRMTPAVVALLLCSVPLGIALGGGLGYIVEARVRRNATAWLVAGLMDVQEDRSVADQFQIVSHDFDAVNERVAWYLHDIAWIASLATITALTSLSSVGWQAVIPCGLIGFGYVWLWRRRVPVVKRTRLEFSSGMNRLLEAVEDVGATKELDGVIADTLRGEFVNEGLAVYIDHRTHMNAARLSLGLYAGGFTAGLALILALCLSFINADAAWAAVVFTAILSLDAEILRLLLALSGFQSQALALYRLREFGQIGDKPPLAFWNANGEIITRAFQADPSHLQFCEGKFSVGHAFSLLGHSGSGKSQFLKSVAGIIHAHPTIQTQFRMADVARVIYVDNRWAEALGESANYSLESFLTDLCQASAGPMMLILDEAVTTVPPEQAKNIVDRLCEQLGERGVVMVVDHRFQLPHAVNIEDFRLWVEEHR